MQKNVKKILFLFNIFIIIGLIFNPIDARALSVNSINFSDGFNLLVSASPKSSSSSNDNWESNYNRDQDCSGSNSLLGNPSDPDSVAWLLQQLLIYIKILGPILVIVLSSIDFTKCIVKSDDDAMAAAKKKLGYRLILAGLLFFIPTVVQVILNIFGITSDPTCGIQ